jgi:hypothetical protein
MEEMQTGDVLVVVYGHKAESQEEEEGEINLVFSYSR